MLTLTRRQALLGAAAAVAGCKPADLPTVQTVSGPQPAAALGTTLAHEHIITDLRALNQRTGGDYDRQQAIATCLPYLQAAKAAGAATIVDPSPMFTRPDVEALRMLAGQSGLTIVCATGIYGAASQAFIPSFARTESAEQLAERYVAELTDGVDNTGIRPAIIKTGVNRQVPLPPVERKLVEAAFHAQRISGAPVAIHTGPAAAVFEEIDIRDKVAPGAALAWVHAQNERDLGVARELAAQNLWVSYDGVSEGSAEWILQCLKEFAEAGLLGHVLLSQDAGWYRPGEQDQSQYRAYTYLLTDFLPALRNAGFGDAEIDRLLVQNPARFLTGLAPSA